jgi:hypothetical protein
MSEATGGLRGFLDAHGAQARYAGVAFPAGSGCEAPVAATVAPLPSTTRDSSAVLAAQAQLVATELTRRAPAGGTPTAATLDLVRRADEPARLRGAGDGRPAELQRRQPCPGLRL